MSKIQRHDITATYILENWSSSAKHKKGYVVVSTTEPEYYDSIKIIDSKNNTYDIQKLTNWILENSGLTFKRMAPASWMVKL